MGSSTRNVAPVRCERRLVVRGVGATAPVRSEASHHIRAGTAMPIRSSARVSCARKYATPAARHTRTSDTFLVQDRRVMIERIELLRQTERPLGQHRELERPHHLFDDFIEPGRLEHQRPQVLVAVGSVQRGWRRARECRHHTVLGQPVPVPQLGEDVVGAYRSEYCRYGPLSPSKLRASSMSKAMILDREYLTRK